ncbi:MAG TPA: ABC transporter substrate-binding protein [Candidatus Binatia bacterium]|nr:ABC transporter substrate-binding protein [Candidatus Binatia bacterium]
MTYRRPCRTGVALILLMMLVPLAARAASAPYKVIYTFGGLNERSGILWVARDAGIFQKYGIDPTIVNVRNAQVGMSALAAGETQFHVGSATGTSIGAMAGGLDLAYIAGLINKLDGAFMVNPSIKTPADLKGKRVGVQSIGGGVWMFSMLAFEHWGLNPERDNIQFRIIGDQSVLAQAITQNIIDGGYLGYAYGAQLERQGYRMLGDLMKMGIPYQGLGMIAKRSLIDRTPEIPERTLRAMVEAITYVNNPGNKAAVVKTLTRELRLSKIEDAQTGYEMMRTLYDKKIYPNADGLRNVVRLLGKTSEPIRKLKVEEIIDDRIVKKLEKEGLF